MVVQGIEMGGLRPVDDGRNEQEPREGEEGGTLSRGDCRADLPMPACRHSLRLDV